MIKTLASKSNNIISMKVQFQSRLDRYLKTLDKIEDPKLSNSYKEDLRKELVQLSIDNKLLDDKIRLLAIKNA